MTAFVGIDADSDPDDTTPSASLPAGVQAGDQLLAVTTDLGITPLATWSLLRTQGLLRVWVRTAGAEEPAFEIWSGGNPNGLNEITVVAYTDTLGVAAHAGNQGPGGAWTAPSVFVSSVVTVVAFFTTANGFLYVDSPSILRSQNDAGSQVVADRVSGPGTTTGTTLTQEAPSITAISVALLPGNVAPNAPTLTSMADGGSIDRPSVNRASHAFSDSGAGDSQSAFDLRYRTVGSPTWTTLNVVTPNQYYDFPANSLAAGDYERQVRTYDSLGLVGPYSTSGFFSAATAPAGPAITSPINGQDVQQLDSVTWSTPNQDAYQVRRVADSGGSPDTGVVYFDTGAVADTTTRTLPLTFATNNRAEHVQVRVRDDGLWSAWVSVQVDVTYTPPPIPTIALVPEEATGSLLVEITNPAPGAGDPATSYNDIYIEDADGAGELRKATQVLPNTAWRYWTPRSGVDYVDRVRVVAVAPNGTTASS